MDPRPLELEESMTVQQQPALEQTIITTATKLPSAHRLKRRAKRACQSCRLRKVRCNVQVHGIPCVNCSMDDVNCVISGPRRKKRATSSTEVTCSKTSPNHSPFDNHSNGRAETELVDYLITSLESLDDFNSLTGNTYVSASLDSKYDVPSPKPARASSPHFSSDTVTPPTTERSFHRACNPSFTSSEQFHRPTTQQLLNDCRAVAAAASKAVETALLYTNLHVCEQISRNCNCKCSCAFSNTSAISPDNPSECYPSPHASFAAWPPDLVPQDDLEAVDKPERCVTKEDLHAAGVDAFSRTRLTISADSDEAVPVEFRLDLPIVEGSFHAMAEFDEDIEIDNFIKESSY